jgi:hypothetical protein
LDKDNIDGNNGFEGFDRSEWVVFLGKIFSG